MRFIPYRERFPEGWDYRYVYTDKLHKITDMPNVKRILIDGKMANPYDHHILNRKQALEKYPEYFL